MCLGRVALLIKAKRRFPPRDCNVLLLLLVVLSFRWIVHYTAGVGSERVLQVAKITKWSQTNRERHTSKYWRLVLG